jgi:hypothetical protein
MRCTACVLVEVDNKSLIIRGTDHPSLQNMIVDSSNNNIFSGKTLLARVDIAERIARWRQRRFR